MNPRLALLLVVLGLPCWAQAASTAPPNRAEVTTKAEAAKAAQPAAEPPRGTPNEPAVQHIVVQDRDTRIDELRVRGQTRRIVVTGRGGTRYEVIPADGLRDLPDTAGTTQGAAGKRVWRVLSF